MSIQFSCPKCAQKLTLTASKPGDWLDCPNCEATVQVPGGAPPAPARSATAARPAPKSAAPEPLDLPDNPSSRGLLSDKRVQLGAVAVGMGLLFVALLVLALTQKKDKAPEQVRNDPPPVAQPAPPVAPPVKKDDTSPKPKDDVQPKPKDDVQPKPKDDTPPKPKDDTPPKPMPNYINLDQFGNPIDQNTGLAQKDEFKGQRLLFWCAYKGGGGEDPLVLFGPKNPLWKALEDKGFVVTREFGRFNPDWLKNADQCWILSGMGASGLDAAAVAAIGKFVDAGKGLCLLADNDPFTVEADQLARNMFGVRISGNAPGTKIAFIRRPQLTPADIKKYKGDYEVADHPLLAGVNFVYEGITISTVSASNDLDVALKGSDGNPVVVLSKSPKRRVVIDCGFTRYYHHSTDRGLNFIEKTAGTTRLAQNMAAYLAGKNLAKEP